MSLTISENIPYLSLAGNPIKVKIHTNNLFDGATRRPFYTIILNVYDSGSNLLRELSEEPNDSGDAWFNLSDVFETLKPTLSHPLEPDSPVQSDNIVNVSIGKFYFKLAEGYGIPYVEQAESATSGNYCVIPGGLPDWYLRKLSVGNTTFYDQLLTQNIWLTNQPAVKTVFPDQPEQLRFFSLSNQTVTYEVKRLNSNGLETYHTLWSGSLEASSLYSFLASPEFCAASDTVMYTLYLNANGTKITNDAVFSIEKAKPHNTRYVLFQNSLGGFDCAALTGKMVTELETSTVDFSTPEISKIREAFVPGQERSLGIKYLTGTIGWKNNDELEWLSELLHSENRQLVVNESDLESIVISADRRKIADDTNAPKTFSIEAIIGVEDFFFLASE